MITAPALDEHRTTRISPLLSPALLRHEHPIDAAVADTVTRARTDVVDILDGRDDRLLVGTDGGTLFCLSRVAPPEALLVGFARGALRCACVSADEKTLYVCDAASVGRCELGLEDGVCAPPVPMVQLAASLGVGCAVADVACDVSGSVYVAASSGVVVVDDTGNAMVRLATPAPVCTQPPAATPPALAIAKAALAVTAFTQRPSDRMTRDPWNTCCNDIYNDLFHLRHL